MEDVANRISEALVPYNKEVARDIQEATKARALDLHGEVMDKLASILRGKDDKAALTAAGLILKIGGGMKTQSVKVQATFNQLMEAAPLQAGPLAGLTQITASAVIDAEEDDDDGDTTE
jgi:hypothetical protein